MLWIRYAEEKAKVMNRPLVVLLGVGSNLGAHDGTLLLERFIDKRSAINNTNFVIAAGNEANLGHHYLGQFVQKDKYQDVEFSVDEDESSIYLGLYSTPPDYYSIGIISPTGEFISRIPVRRQKFETISLVLEKTTINVTYNISEVYITNQVITILLKDPVPGTWTIRIFGDMVINGRYDIYLPREDWCKDGTKFLQPNPFTTVTFPGTSKFAITTGSYNHITGSLSPFSGRGLTTTYKQKPDLVAPGNNILGPMPNNTFGTMTGTSASAAITAGAVALLLQWAIVQQNLPTITPELTKIWLIRGADKKDFIDYPNPMWGYGELDLRGSFQVLRDIYLD